MSGFSAIMRTFVFKLAIASSAVVVLLQIFQWDVIDTVTPFLMVFVDGPVFMLFVISLTWSIVHAVRKRKTEGVWACVPMAINIATILAVLLIPFTAMTIELDFHTKLKARKEVIEKIRAGDLKNNVDYNKALIRLPVGFPNVSKGGNDILYENNDGKLSVFFFTFRGVIDNYSGIIYKEDNTPPSASDFNCGDMLDSKKFKDNWFWMACT